MTVRLTPLLVAISLAACAQPSDGPTTEPEPEVISPERLATLSRFIPASGIEAIRVYETAFRAIATEEDFAHAFRLAAGLDSLTLIAPDSLDIYEAIDFFQPFAGTELGIPGLEASCGAECTEPSFAIDAEAWAGAAAATPSPSDDRFVSLFSDFFGFAGFYRGSFEGYGSFFTQTWDYGGYSNLGSGAHAALLGRIDSLSGESERFSAYLDQMRASLMDDATGWNVCFGPASDAVAAELTAMSGLSSLSDDDRTAIANRLDQLGTHEIETDCEHVTCSCASG